MRTYLVASMLFASISGVAYKASRSESTPRKRAPPAEDPRPPTDSSGTGISANSDPPTVALAPPTEALGGSSGELPQDADDRGSHRHAGAGKEWRSEKKNWPLSWSASARLSQKSAARTGRPTS